MILTVTCSKQAEAATPSSLGPFAVELKGTIAAALQKQFVRQIAEVHGALLRPPDRKDVLGVLKHRAKTVFELVLLWLGVTDLAEHDYASASRLFRILDSQLAGKSRKDEKPRVTIRRLDSLALIAPSRFPADTLPGPEALEAATITAHEGVRRYGDQFPDVRLALARDLFYGNQLDEALSQTNTALTFPLEDEAKRVAVLHLAVLNLLLDRPENAADSFDELSETQSLAFLDWNDLMRFADFAFELGHQNAVFLQALYRRFAGRTEAGNAIEEEAFRWLRQDASRARLRHFLDKAKRVKTKGAEGSQATGKRKRQKAQKPTKSAPRRKTRKKRRRR
jgi:hypothetical protein